MARARRQTTSKTTNSGESTLTCPDCGKTFTRPASLGAHRNRAHGVSGASSRRGRSRTGGALRRRTGTKGTAQQATRARSRATSSDGRRTRLDRDTLLQTIFPNGVPAREDVIRRANAWLDEAEKLARTK